MGVLKGSVKRGQRSGSGGKFTPEGKHVVQIKRCFEKNGYKGESAGVEFDIVESSNPTVQEAIKSGTASYKWICNITKHKDAARGNIADFVKAAVQTLNAENGIYFGTLEGVEAAMSDDEFDKEMDEVFGVSNKMVKHFMQVEVTVVKTGNDTDFSAHKWSAPEELLDEAKKKSAA